MLPRMKISTGRQFAIPAHHWINGGRIARYQKPDFVIDFLVFNPILLFFGPFYVSLSLEISLNLCDNYSPFKLLLNNCLINDVDGKLVFKCIISPARSYILSNGIEHRVFVLEVCSNYVGRL